MQGLERSLADFRAQAQRQEDRSNDERNAMAVSIAALRDRQTEFATEVRVEIKNARERLDSLGGSVRELSESRQTVLEMKNQVDAIATRVAKIETPFAKMLATYQRVILLFSVCGTIGFVFLYFFGEPFKAFVLRLTGK